MRVLIYTGKGGVGKTSVAAATAITLAKAGQRVLIASTDQAHSLADSFEIPLGCDPTAVAPCLDAVEIDAVFPYRNFLAGDYQTCADFVALISKITGKKHPSKIILETGVIEKAALIARAAGICIDNGANFIKTSTGKTPVSATPEAANVILETVASGRRNVGFKASGGIKTIDDAKKYLVLANAIMGWKWISPSNFRIGASSLLDNLIEVIERGY